MIMNDFISFICNFGNIADIIGIITFLFLIVKTDFLYIKSLFDIKRDYNKQDIWLIGEYENNLLHMSCHQGPILTSLNYINTIINSIGENNTIKDLKLYYCCNDSTPIIKFNTKFSNNCWGGESNCFWNLRYVTNDFDIVKGHIFISHQSLTKDDLKSKTIKFYSLGKIKRCNTQLTWYSKLERYLKCNIFSGYFDMINITWFQMALKYLNIDKSYSFIMFLFFKIKDIIKILNPFYWYSDQHCTHLNNLESFKIVEKVINKKQITKIIFIISFFISIIVLIKFGIL